MKNYVNVDMVDKGLCNNLETYKRRAFITRLRCFSYENSRSGERANRFLKDFNGILISDGYGGYLNVAMGNLYLTLLGSLTRTVAQIRNCFAVFGLELHFISHKIHGIDMDDAVAFWD